MPSPSRTRHDSDPGSDIPERLARTVRRTLLRWFARHRRDLPWRRDRRPYPVWIAETMLQQTRAATAWPYYQRFLRLFPDVRALAAASLEKVLKAWEGLGYYTRARNLHRAAGVIVSRHGGRLPRTAGELLDLPGVGPYTAGAVASIAFGADEPAVDGNAVRVLCRLLEIDGPPNQPATRHRLWDLARRLLPPNRAGEFNEALMDLGATVCLPRKPRCPDCPLKDCCRARAAGRADELPLRASRRPLPHHTVVAAVIRRNGRILIDRRKPQGLLGGLWEFPGGKVRPGETLAEAVRREVREEVGLEVNVLGPLATVGHAYSHFRITLHAFRCRAARGRARPIACDTVRWVRPGNLDRFAFPKANQAILAALRGGKACGTGR